MNKLIVIAGPTASGKTSSAIFLAQKFHCPIVSADSRQIYQELNVGVARPSTQELSLAKHYFIASHSIHSPLNAGTYEKEAIALLELLFQQHPTIILCGGTGLYIKAVLEGLDEMPHASIKIRNELQNLLEQEGIESLQNLLQKLDPDFYQTTEIHNPQRLIRAIEIVKISGKSNLEYRVQHSKKRNFDTASYYIDIERNTLYERINNRVDIMIAQGLEEEARNLMPFKELEPLKTVGYKEFFDFFDGKLSRQECIEKIKQNTRNYAKRQTTWFKNQGNFTPIAPSELENLF